MKVALLFINGERVLVTAEEVKNGKFPPSEYEFVDPEYEYKVQFVCSAKNKGGPYFRLYYSYEDYKKLYPDRADRYKIVADMRRYQECIWHKNWKKDVSHFCIIEKCIRNPKTGKYRFADAYYPALHTCIEFQHSYIALDFEERNKFHYNLGNQVIWLYDLPKASVCDGENGSLEILEDNARGFFRISENPENLKQYPVYIQVKSKMIYRVEELNRLETHSETKSSIRCFRPSETYTPETFIEAIRSNRIKPPEEQPCLMPLSALWRDNFSNAFVLDAEKDKIIMINRDHNGHLYRNNSGCIIYQYAERKGNQFHAVKGYEYPLSKQDENTCKWRLLKYYLKNN